MMPTEMSQSPTGNPSIWFERLCARLGVSYLTGVLLIGTVPAVAGSVLASYLLGAYDASSPQRTSTLLSLLVFMLVPAVCFFGSRYVVRTTGALCEYARGRNTQVKVDQVLDRLGSFKFVGFVSGPLALVIVLLTLAEGSSPGFNGVAGALNLAITVYISFVVGTLVWVFGYAMYTIHRLGSEPMDLSPFGEDRSLGLKPFGTAAFHLTLVYLGAITVLGIHVNIPPLPALTQLGLLSLFLLAIPLFLLPLLTVHRHLVRARSRELDWIGKRYAALFTAIKAADGPPRSAGLENDVAALSALRQLRDDVEGAPTWPFDSQVVTALVAILLSVSAVLMSAVIRDVLKF